MLMNKSTGMKNTCKLVWIIVFWAVIGGFTVACKEAKEEPSLTGTVSIFGNTWVGQILTANTNTLGGSGTISYQWKCGTTNVGENKGTYTVQTADAGSVIRLTVTRSGYSGSVTSDPTTTITAVGPSVLTGTVIISGNAYVGQTLTAITASLEGSGTISYQWKRDSINIGTNSDTYTVQTADLGYVITVTVNRADNSGSVSSSPTTFVINATPTEGLAYVLIKGGTEYSVSLGTASASGTIVIPDVYNGLPVTAIANNAFSSSPDITNIIIPDSITNIGISAFADCSGLTRIIIPNRVTNIDANAFKGCTRLTMVTFMGTITSANFSSTSPFPGDLRTKYFAEGVGIYSRPNGTTDTWTGAPAGLTTTAATTSSITISWSSVTGAIGYRIYRGTSATVSEIGTSITNSFKDTGLTEGTTYYYKVAAYYNGGTSPLSSVLNTRSVPGIPGGVTATVTSSSSITISWTSVTGATGYRIYHSTSANGTFTEIGTSTTTSYTITELVGNTIYYYRVAAYNNSGTGEQSNAVSETTELNAPAGVTARATSANSITVNWNSVPGAIGYRIYRNTSAAGTFTEVGISATTSFIDTEVNASTTYYYRVAAYDSSRTGPQSSSVVVVPDRPAGVYATATSSISILVSWSSVTGAIGYRIYRSTNANGTFSEVGTSTITSYANTSGLIPSTTYYYKVAAYNSSVTGEQSNAVNATTMPPPPLEMVLINFGTFTMGSPASEANRSDEIQHQVTISKSFYMGKYEVTQEQYQVVMGVNPSFFERTGGEPAAGEIQSRRPVESVSWYDAIVFCNRLSIREGLTPAYRIYGSTNPSDWGNVPTSNNATWNAVTVNWDANGYRLPTEAEWEYACRAGTTTAYNTGNTISDNTGWYSSNSGDKTHEVGKKPANAYGLHDMHGNVSEWCWDWYGSYTSVAQTDPRGAASGSRRVHRGGSWSYYALYLRSAVRSGISAPPYYGGDNFGFRVVRP